MSMTDNDKKEFYVLMKGCSEIYKQDLSNAIVSIFWNMLEAYEIKSVKNAFSEYLKNPKNQFFPRPSQIIEEIEGRKEDKSLQAWSKAFNAKLHFGSSRSVVFDDLIIHDVISDFGGWIKFCDLVHNEKSLSFTQREFLRRYEGYLDGWHSHSKKVLLGGEAVDRISYNRQHTQGDGLWQPLPKPFFVGDRQKCRNNFLSLQESENLKLSTKGDYNDIPAISPLPKGRS